MGATADPARLFAERSESYARFIRFVRYPQGLRAYFRASPFLHAGIRVLDAGCGTGVVTLALREALVERGCEPAVLQGFDLTPAMLERFRTTLRKRRIDDIELAEANVLELERLPASWRNYDLVVSSAMLEYVPRSRFGDALAGLRGLLVKNGVFVLFITRRNLLTRPLIGRWWCSHLYGKADLEDAFRKAGFSSVAFGRFPLTASYLSLWGLIVEARPDQKHSTTPSTVP